MKNYRSIVAVVMLCLLLVCSAMLTGCSVDAENYIPGRGEREPVIVYYDCDECSGSGWCITCGGYGTCGRCENGRKDCMCDNGICDFCDGKGRTSGGYYSTFGYVSSTCSFCKGKGIHVSCGGRGYTACSSRYCDGGVCTDCRGTGYCSECR